MKRLYYWYYRKRYHIPCRSEIQEALDRAYPYINDIILKDMTLYVDGLYLEDIARLRNITQERVRQRLLKAVRTLHRLEDN